LLFLADCGGDVARLASGARLLVPVNGGPDARSAAEIACAIARGTGASVHALFVSQTGGSARTRAGEESVLKDISDLGERYGVRVSTHISPRAGASDAIIMESRQNFALIVIGAASRPGDALFFGNTINDVLSASTVPVLLLAS
jgi:nucleotide-binding universal stress UspA family protein